jgi:hypothetical protein
MVQSKSLGVFTIILLAKKRRDCTVLLELPGNAHQIQLPVSTSITRRQDAINELTGTQDPNYISLVLLNTAFLSPSPLPSTQFLGRS